MAYCLQVGKYNILLRHWWVLTKESVVHMYIPQQRNIQKYFNKNDSQPDQFEYKMYKYGQLVTKTAFSTKQMATTVKGYKTVINAYGFQHLINRL